MSTARSDAFARLPVRTKDPARTVEQSAPLIVETTESQPIVQKAFRALGSHHLTSGFGVIFKEKDEGEYSKSYDAEGIDDFISHPWMSAWWKKGLSLCFIYNHSTALFAGHAVSLAMLVLGRLAKSNSLVSDQMVLLTVTWVPVLVFFTVLLFGQMFLSHLVCSTFLDKACINQETEEEKKKGIRKLWQSLRQSLRFIILWDENHFSRLWCVWEAAIYFKSKKDAMNHVLIAPTFLSVLNIVGCCAATSFVMLGDVLRVTGALNVMFEAYRSDPNRFECYTCAFLSGSYVCAVTLFSYFLSHFIESMQTMEGQLKDFTWHGAECFKEEDRPVLAEEVRDLWGSVNDFEQYLRQEFIRDCMGKLGGSTLPYATCLSICSPLWWCGVGRLAVAKDGANVCYVLLSYGLIYFVGCPLQIWNEKVTLEYLVPRLGTCLQRNRLAISLAVALPFTVQCIPILFFGMRIASYLCVNKIDPSFERPDTFTPFLSFT